MSTILLLTLLLPLVGAIFCSGQPATVRRIALLTVFCVFLLAVALAATYPGGNVNGHFAAIDFAWFKASSAMVDIRFSIALDGLNLWLFVLTALLDVVAVLVSWQAIEQQVSLYYRLLLVLESGLLGVFTAQDIILFYIFFEFTLIPLFFLIGIWGGEKRRPAAVKFFLYTLSGSVLTLLGLLSIVFWDYWHPIGNVSHWPLTFSIPAITEHLRIRPLDPAAQIWIFWALFAGFAIKTPLFPLHTWLPLAHVEAPTAGSVILAGVLLKVGTYGFARFSLPMLPEATATLMPWLMCISLAGIIYGSLVALAQQDIKRLIAYSSVAHLGFCMLGMFSLNRLGYEGSLLQMVNHGISTGGLFAVVGMIYERYHTREIADLGGLARRMPRLAFFTLILVLSSIAMPGLNGFVGEFLVLLGAFQRGWMEAPAHLWLLFRIIGLLGIVGVILGAWYMLWLYQRVFFGELREPPRHGRPEPQDLSPREIACLLPLIILIFWIGLQPQFFIKQFDTPDFKPPAAVNKTIADPH